MSKPLTVLSWVLITLLVVLLNTTASSAVNAQVAMKIAHVVPGDAPRGRGASKVAQLVTDDHRCTINAKVYPSAQLGGDTDLIECPRVTATTVEGKSPTMTARNNRQAAVFKRRLRDREPHGKHFRIVRLIADDAQVLMQRDRTG